MGSLSENLARLRGRIADAAQSAGRSAEDITLVAVTKKHPVETIRAALDVGLNDLGENYVQEAVEKRAQVGDHRATWHFLGHLQTNKAKLAVQTFDMIESVDSVGLAQVIGRHALALSKTQEILLQVHLGDEETKFGLVPESVGEAAMAVLELPGVSLWGLMGIAPQGEDPRPHFQKLRRLFEALPSAHRQILSMGMTADFETAIQEGATMIRVGTALFGPRTA